MALISMPTCQKESRFSAPLHDDYELQLFESIDAIEAEWAMVSDSHDIFYSAPFLKCIERATPSGITPYYCLVTKKALPIGIIYLQAKAVRLKENLKVDRNKGGWSNALPMFWLKKWLISRINFYTVICGNLMLTGRYGFYFPGNIGKEEEFRLVAEATKQLQAFLRKKGISPGLILVKDFFVLEAPIKEDSAFEFTRFTVQPKMLLHLRPSWMSFEDYLSDLKSKYRVRWKKAMQKGAEIEKKTLAADEIAQFSKVIATLYRHVADQADFNAFYLHERYFEELKLALGEAMTLTSYWKKGKMVAFFTSIANYDILDAHFLGYDPEENQECQIYLNMLYDLIREGIDKKMTCVDMSRTAIEIKSTVGAVPHEMYLYLKHSQPMLNKATGAILGLVKPNDAFVIRTPFRDDPED